MTRLLNVTLCLVAVFAVESCVYYNTFYNAKKKYRQGEDERTKSEADPENRGLRNTYRNYYLVAIRKASTILQLHPDSDWVDDSLLLMGKAYYWREEHGEAIQKFNELVDNFPQSEHLDETRYWLGVSLWGRQDLAEARSALTGVGQGSGKFAWQARLALAELEFSDGNFEPAIALFQGLLGTEKDKRLRARVWRGLGDAHFDQRNLEASLEAYENVLDNKPDEVTSFVTRQQIGRVYELQGDFDAALATYDRISRIKRFKDYEPRVRLMKANVLTLRDQIDEAVAAYEAIIKQYPRTEHSAEAYYQLGVIDYRTHGDSEAAMENLKSARLERSGTSAAERAGAMEKTLFLLNKVRKQSEREGKRGMTSLFDLAELYLFSLGEVDSAVATYERAITRAESEDPGLAPKALYAIALIQADSLKDQAGARSSFQKLIDHYSNTSYAAEARNRTNATRSDDLLAEARYLEAETLLAEGVVPLEEIVTLLEQVSQEYPNSLAAPQALFMAGWIYENRLGDLPRARRYYEAILNDYTENTYAERVQEKIDGRHLDADDSGTPPFLAFEVDTPPILYRSQEPEDDTEVGTAIVSVLVGRDGVPRRTSFVSGPKKTKTAAEKAAREYRFIPARHGGIYVDSWVEVPVEFGSTASFEGAIARSGPPPLTPLDYVQAETKPAILERHPVETSGALDHPEWVNVRFLVGEDGTARLIEPQYASTSLRKKVLAVAKKFKFKAGGYDSKPRSVWMETGIDILEQQQKKTDPAKGARPLEVFETHTQPVVIRAGDPGTYNPRFEGATAVVNALIDVDGRVEKTTFLSGPPGLERTASRIARGYRFRPATYIKKPIPAWVELPITVNGSRPFTGPVLRSDQYSLPPLDFEEADVKPYHLKSVEVQVHGITGDPDSVRVGVLVGADGSYQRISLPEGDAPLGGIGPLEGAAQTVGVDKMIRATRKIGVIAGSHEGVPRDIWYETSLVVKPSEAMKRANSSRPKTVVLEVVGRIDLQFDRYDWDFVPYLQDLRRRVLANLEETELPPGQAYEIKAAPDSTESEFHVVSQTGEQTVACTFRILRDGRIKDVETEDEEFSDFPVKPRIKAIKDASPVAALPDDISDVNVTAIFSNQIEMIYKSPPTRREWGNREIRYPLADTFPRLLKQPELDYPETARKAGIEGTILLEALVGVDGGIREIIPKGPDLFHKAALAWADELVFEPATLDGAPISAWVRHRLRFRLK
ncbi:MAG: hypothetical protein CME26_08325 [Gemmatimonadetes bacterium]|nr:hypothetical protein [Gemmatimonadota bacterium]